MNNYLDLLVAFQPDLYSALWQSRAWEYSCMGHSHYTKIDISCWIIHFTRNTSVYAQLFTCDCSIFFHNISLSEILGQAIYRTWWKHNDLFCPTFCYNPYSSLFRLQWLSSTTFQPFWLTCLFCRMNVGTFGVALGFGCSAHSGASMPCSSSISDPASPSQLSSLAFASLKWPLK